jgi:flavin reductase (DIM6/NTAB) family NADH-FMN oxidoreductase RutF
MGSLGTESEIISPAIFYWGTPVVLITTENEDGTFNIAPMSSAWWLGNRCLLGLGAISQTTLNLRRTKQCVLNLASDDMVNAVNALAKTTGTKAVATASPDEGYLYFKRKNGYKYVQDKFKHAGLSPLPSDLIRPARVAECPVQMEAELKAVHEMKQDVDGKTLLALEVMVLRTHIHGNIRMQGHANRIDPDKWRPLIMSFQEFYALGPRKIEHSLLAEIQEEAYRSMSNSVDEEDGDRGEDTR